MTRWAVAILASYLVVLAPRAVHAASPPDPEPDPAVAAPPAEPGAVDETRGTPVTMEVGVDLERVTKFDVTSGSFDAELVVTVTCDHEPCAPTLELLNGRVTGKPELLANDKLFKKYKYKAELEGEFDYSHYPFDAHRMSVIFENKGDLEYTKFTIDEKHTLVNALVKIPGWDVLRIPFVDTDTLDLEDGAKMQVLRFDMQLSRPTIPAFFKSILPVIAMLFVAGIGLLLRPKSIGTRFGASTGGLVPLVMFHVGQHSSLPPLGYLTTFDKFMAATYLVFVVHIFFNLLILRSEEVKDEIRSQKLFLIAAGAVPGFALLSWVLVFVGVV